MQLQLGQYFATAEHIVPDDEIALVVIWPFRGLRSHSLSPCASALTFLDQPNRALGERRRLAISALTEPSRPGTTAATAIYARRYTRFAVPLYSFAFSSAE